MSRRTLDEQGIDDEMLPRVSPLNSLSPELLRKIAVCCRGKSIITFASICRSIHTVCRDPLVFRESVHSQLRDASRADARAVDTRLLAITGRAGNDSNVWARYAVALSKVVELPEMSKQLARSGESRTEILKKTMAWMPQLLALGCMHTLDANLASDLILNNDLACSVRDKEPISQLAFCFASEVSEDENLHYSAPSSQHPGLPATFWTLRTSLVNELIVDPEQFFHNRYQVYILVASLTQALNSKNLPTPNFSSLPILSLMDASNLPVPFGCSEKYPENTQWDKWLYRVSSGLASKSNLSNGEWCGYVSADPYLLTFNGFLEDIWLEVDHQDDTTCFVKSNGKEGSQIFTLEGTVMKADGRVLITQIYPGFQTCLWHGLIIPFGIVGYWNMAFAPRTLSFFWIWKKQWTKLVDTQGEQAQ